MNINPALSPFIILFAFALYGLLHSITASLKLKKNVRVLLGSFGDSYYRILFNIFAVLSFIPVFALVYWLPDKTWYSLSSPWSILFNAVRLLFALLLLISATQTGLMQFIGFSQVLGTDETDNLKTNGLYKYMRHPIYTFTMTFFWFSPIMSQNSAAFYLAISLYSIIGAIYEERKLIKAYGQDYIDYQSKTPMLIPFLTKKS